MKPLLLLYLIAAIYLACFLWVDNYGAFWSEDAGVKYLQALSLVRSHWTDSSLHYPGERLDTRMQFNPLAGTHTYVRDGKIYSIYPLPFPFLSSIALALFGFPGLYILPLVSTLLLLAFTYRLDRLLFGMEHALIVTGITAFCTPIIFYAFTFWEINVATFLLLSGLFLCVRNDARPWKMIAGGALMGSAVFFREELILFVVSYAVVLLLARRESIRCALVGVGAGISVLGFVLLQCVTGGLKMAHLFHNISVRPREFSTMGNVLRYKWGLVCELLFRGHADARVNALLLSPVLVLAVWLVILGRKGICVDASPPKFSSSRGRWDIVTPALFSVILVSYLCYVGMSLAGRYPIRSTPFTSGLLLFSPWVVTGLYRLRGKAFSKYPACHCERPRHGGGGRQSRLYKANARLRSLPRAKRGGRFAPRNDNYETASGRERSRAELFWTTVIFILLICLAVPTSGGLQWGPRYLAVIYPLLVIISWDSFVLLRGTARYRRWLTAIFVGLIVVGAVHEIFGIHLLKKKKEFNRAVMERLSASETRTVISLPWWIPLSTASIFYEKDFFAARDPNTLDRLVDLLKKNRQHDFILVAESDPQIIAMMEERYGMRPARIEQVRSAVDAYFTVNLIHYRMRDE